MPLGVGLNLELIAMLRRYLAMAGWETGDISQLYSLALDCMDER